MYEIHTEIDIKAPASKVWSVLTDFGAYPSWNPFVKEISGDTEPGSKLSVLLEQPGSRPMAIKPRVTEFQPGRRFSWLGHMFVKGLFDGEHSFEVQDLGAEECRFVQRERFAGVLVPFFRTMLDTKTVAGFQAMNRALEERAMA